MTDTDELITTNDLITAVVDWFDDNARDLPWRRSSPWGVMVSEFMLQQTPVSRVLEPWDAWMTRWPAPADLAAVEVGEAIRAWGRLGYPRRAMRLHASAVAITADHGGEVPDDYEVLLSLPGVGSYTAAAIASFAYGRAEVVLDTNVRRVLARSLEGTEFAPNSPTAAERRLATSLRDKAIELDPVPADPELPARWAAASMELGAVVCRAANPDCGRCPIQHSCTWVLAGKPAHDGPARRGQTYAGTDRQVRGRLLEILRTQENPVPRARLDLAWGDRLQRDRALASLLADGLVSEGEPGWFGLG